MVASQTTIKSLVASIMEYTEHAIFYASLSSSARELLEFLRRLLAHFESFNIRNYTNRPVTRLGLGFHF